MKTVIIESPLQGGTEREADNIAYARRCMADSLARGEAPFASHLLYPQVLDDTNYEQRARGIEAGLVIGRLLDLRAVYIDRGITLGMCEGLAEDAEIEVRTFCARGGNLPTLDRSRTLTYDEALAQCPGVADYLVPGEV